MTLTVSPSSLQSSSKEHESYKTLMPSSMSAQLFGKFGRGMRGATYMLINRRLFHLFVHKPFS